MRPELGIVRVPRKDSFIERTRQPPQMLNRNGIRSSRFPLLPVASARVSAVPASTSMSDHLSENSCPTCQPVMYAITINARH